MGEPQKHVHTYQPRQPEELCEKIAALVPPPNSHLTRYSGVFSSHSKWRDKVVPCPEKPTGFYPDGGPDRKKVKNHRWAKLLARTFQVDVGTSPVRTAVRTWRSWGLFKIPGK
jgi:hypothetical protein